MQGSVEKQKGGKADSSRTSGQRTRNSIPAQPGRASRDRPGYARPGSVRLLATACLVMVLANGILLSILLGRLWRAVSAVRADLNHLETMVGGDAGSLDVEATARWLSITRSDLAALQTTARPFLWLAPYLGWIPRHGRDIQAAPVLLEIGLVLSGAGEEVLEPLAPLFAQDRPAVAEQQSLSEVLLSTLSASEPSFRAALAAVERSETMLGEIAVQGLSPRVQGWVARLDRYLPLAKSGIKGALILPEVMGLGHSRTYLLLVQNEDELRATGGFISAVARVVVQDGALREVHFEDSYSVDDLTKEYPAPPEPLTEYMLAGLWLFRDSNWSPDFPTSARQAMALYAIGHGVEADGVIALDQAAIRLLVGVLAPLQVEGRAEPVTRQDVIQAAREAWNPGEKVTGEWWKHRKDFMASVLDAAMQCLQSDLTQDRVVGLAQASLAALEGKHLLVHLEDQEAAALLSELGWDGAIHRHPGDYVMVVDSNMGFNKANALVEQSLEYRVDLSDLQRPRAMLTVRHKHLLNRPSVLCRHEARYDSTYEQMMERCYWNYLRVYVPLGIELGDAMAHAIPGEDLLSGRPNPAQVIVGPPEHGRNVLATFLLLHTAQTLETRFEYLLPSDVVQVRGEEARYVLEVQKQPGTHRIPLHVWISIPPYMEPVVSEPQPVRATEAGFEYTFMLERDQVLQLTLRPRQ